jgi:SAM-dependent methyltransferase
MKGDSRSSWNDEETVRKFAEKDPDRRLLAYLQSRDQGEELRALDLGCAGGRNTVVLAERGADFTAVDASTAMVRETRARVAKIIGQAKAEKRVFTGRMDDLSAFSSGLFDLVIALGIFQNARSRDQWDASIGEAARILKPGGRLLVSNFGPRSEPEGRPLVPSEKEANLYRGFGPEPLYLVEAEALDRDMARHGLIPAVPTETVRRETSGGCRMTINGHYVKEASASHGC